MDSLIQQIEKAFASRSYPGDDNLTHCSYDRKYGGAYDGPCWECQEMAEFFRGKPWRTLRARELRRYGDADALFTIDAYSYFLPAYLLEAVRNPGELDVCVDHLTYRFGPKAEDQFGCERLAAILKALCDAELFALVNYFRFALSREQDWDGYCERSVQNVARELSMRPKTN